MSMDFLDEETIEVSRSQVGTAHFRSLSNAAELKNREADLFSLSHLNGYDNPMLNAGAPLLASCISFSRMTLPDDIYLFRKTLVEQITSLKQQVGALEYPPSVADKCCFLFCVVIDEFILHSEWGEESSWENKTLVSDLFGVRDGGEQFFVVAEKAIQQPKILADILELIYVFLKVGFRGQFRLQGREQLEDIMYRLEKVIFESNRAVNLKFCEKVTLPKTKRPRAPIKFALQLVAFFVVLILLFAGASYWYQSDSSSDEQEFSQLASFNIKQLQGTGQREAVYISVDSDLRPKSGVKVLGISRVKSTALTLPSQAAKPVLTAIISKPVLETWPKVTSKTKQPYSYEAMLKLPANHYSLQILGARLETTIEAFLEENKVKKPHYVIKLERGGEPWYMLLVGDYASVGEAIGAISSLPITLRNQQPWARPVSKIQQQIRNKFNTSGE
jgi:type VI secretion system protein ImpK